MQEKKKPSQSAVGLKYQFCGALAKGQAKTVHQRADKKKLLSILGHMSLKYVKPVQQTPAVGRTSN